ncbi:MAG: LacI family transcriptional regulator [Spirochaetia bacterium]|nr:LacI family transcriptional regulator [Spirochaetia bacterium]
MDIRKVAKLAGVSHMTVSNVLNNRGRMSEKTRKKVLEIINSLDYYPSEAAKILAKGSKDVIAFVSPRLASPFISGILSAIEDRAVETGKYVCGIEHYSTRGVEKYGADLLNRLLFSKKVSAVILLSILPREDVVKKYRDKGVPLVLLESKIMGAHCVHANNISGSHSAVEHLIGHGRKRIGIISGKQIISEKEEMMPTTLERMEGYMSALRGNGIVFEPDFVEEVDDYTAADGAKALDNFIAKKINLDAIFCPAGDVAAMGVMARAKELGIRIPQNLALIGYDDVEASRLLNPALTTVRQPLDKMARAAFDLAIEGMAGGMTEDKVTEFDQELIVRESA